MVLEHTMAMPIIFVVLFSLGLEPTLADWESLSQQPELLGLEETEIVSTILRKADSLNGKVSFNNFTYYNIAVTAKTLTVGSQFIYSYHDSKELEESGGPSANSELCLSQLQDLGARVELLASERGQKKDINLELLLDTWGRKPSGMFLGNYIWPGTYDECRRRKIILSGSSKLSDTRYCLALMKLQDWPLEPSHTIKVGVCLPEACDSSHDHNKYQLIEKILQFNSDHLSETNLDQLYCLPDEQSPIRIWWRSPKTAIFVVLLSIWLSTIVYSTWTGRFKSLSLMTNLELLFDMKRKKPTERRLVDLNVLEGLKGIAGCGFIIAHSLFYLDSKVANINEVGQGSLEYIVVAWGVMVPAFAVDIFFTMTGILTAYLSFKSGIIPLVSKPKTCLQILVLRYIKIMPYYVIATAYSKYIAKYTGSGPLWDYGTDESSHRRMCEQESWLWTLMYGAIWKSPVDHCVPTAWYLANDFLFLLVTPLFFQVLHWRPKLGQLTLLLGIAASYLITSFRIYNMTEDLRPIVTSAGYGAALLIRLMFDTYLMPHYRIAPYLAGLLIGYKLNEYEKKALLEDKEEKKVKLPTVIRKYGKSISLFWLTLLFAWPYVVNLVGAGQHRDLAHLFMYTMYPSGHLMIGTVFGIIIMMASTGHSSKCLRSFLSASIWRPLTKVGLLVALINIEVINYIVQTRTQLIDADNSNLLSFCIFAIVMVHLIAFVLYLLIEAPVRALIEAKPYRITSSTASIKQKTAKN